MTIRTLARLAVAGICWSLMSTAVAEGDPEAGRFAYATCAGCHSIPGYTNVYPSYHVPRLVGQPAEYIVEALRAYRAGERDHGTMLSNAAGLSDEDMVNVAAFIASQDGRPKSPPVRGNVGAGRSKAQEAGCAACHGEDGKSPIMPTYPVLAGQYEDYMAQSLRDYRSGARQQAVMNGIAVGLSDRDIANLAAYYASLSPALDYVRYRQPR